MGILYILLKIDSLLTEGLYESSDVIYDLLTEAIKELGARNKRQVRSKPELRQSFPLLEWTGETLKTPFVIVLVASCSGADDRRCEPVDTD